MALKPFWIKKFHTKLSDRDFNRLLGFDYDTGYRSDSSLGQITMHNKKRGSSIILYFKNKDDFSICTGVEGEGWHLFDNYDVPITLEESQTLLTTGELTQNIDETEREFLLSTVVLKTFVGFYGSLQTINSYCSGIVYEPMLTQKLYFVSITVDDLTANWKLIPIT